ncbi:DYRK-family kinase pom1 [Argentina anserina]|uniref:DYRK-family kinase pom1 n=1 Tax=Argentina anserina TaxID=57926 RepID=UPI002176362A|nr:DYRK-family kinase pom1 [Potentilla anserina]
MEVGAVLEFLKKHGFSEAESALREDMIEKGDLGSFDYEKILFPMAPPLPPVRIPANFPRSKVSDVVEVSSSGDDEFVSLGSSTTNRCSSEFTNPYGIRSTSPGSSKASSDRFSQFGTARNYHDFDMENDLFWHDEKDDADFMTPCFDGVDYFGCPTEDKFVMTSDNEKRNEDLHYTSEALSSEISLNYLDKNRLTNLSSMDAKGVYVTDYYQVEKHQLEGGSEEEPAGEKLKETNLDNCQLNGLGGFLSTNRRTKSSNYSPKKSSTNGWLESVNGKVAGKDLRPNGIDSSEVGINDVDIESHVPETATDEDSEEVYMHNTDDNEYEVFDLRVIHRRNRTGFEADKDLPIVLKTIVAGRYYITEYLGSAAFSKVVQAHDLHTGVDVCLKIIKNDKDFFDQSLDEIKLLKFVNKYDPADERHILRLYDYFYHQEHLFIVCELLKANLYEFQKFSRESGGEAYFTLRRLQAITRQCLEALEYLHHLGVIHCDLKPENILIKSYRRCEIKVIDLGSSCFRTDNLCLYVQSRSYRAPEVILGLSYDEKIDMWSLGCILAELCSGEVLFPNDVIVTILSRIIGMLGPIDLDMLVKGQETDKYFTNELDLYHINEETNQLEYIIPEDSSLEQHLQVTDIGFIDFVQSLLEINPQRRPSAAEALEHPWLSYSYESSSF